MKTITSDFKEQITKLGREIDFQFFLHTNDKLITEDSKFIMTQANAHLVADQFDDEEVDEIIGAEDIYSVLIINRGEILSTMMKEVDFEIAQDLRIGDVIECQFGLKTRSGKNLFDKDSATLIYGTVGTGNTRITSAEKNRTTYIPCKPNTTYTISKRNDGNTNRFAVATTTQTPAIGINTYQGVRDDNASSITITTNATAQYLAVFFYRTDETTLTMQQILDSIQIEEGETATPYEPYGAYDYINYGKYMVYEKEYNEDTRTYSYIAYDRMMLTMQDVSQEFLADLEGRTLANSINVICGKVGLSFNATQQELTDYPNLSKQINEGTFTDLQMTYRDVLDMICQALGLSMIMNPNDKHLLLKPLNNTPVDTFNEQFLKDTNVSFGEKYGPINSVVLSRSEDFDTIYRRDEESISENGLHEYKIKDNLIMLYDDREDYIDEIFEQLNGLEYYPTDFSSTGITYLDWLDFYNVTIGNKTYKCLMLDDEIEINQGLEENIYSEEPLETVTNYKTSSKTDKEVSFIVDKQNGRITGKVSKDDMIASLNIAIEDGQGIVELKGNTVIIQSDNCQLTSDGKLTVEDADVNGKITSGEGTIGGFTLGSTSLSANVQDKYTYTLNDAQRVRDIIMGTVTPTQEDYDRLDVNHDGNIDAIDYTEILRKYYGYASTQGTVILSTEDANRVLYFLGNGSIDKNTSIGIGYVTTTHIIAKDISIFNGSTSINDNGIYTNSLDVTGSKNRVVTIDNGKQVRLGAYETTTPYFGDIGSNKTDKNGYCKIEIEDIFSQTIEKDDYKVFIQECGEGHLYIEKYKDYFEVKGTPNLDFDWEIKAIQKGYKNVRLQEKESDK